MTRKDILDAANKCVNGDREGDYGSPERNFDTIAKFWNAYIQTKTRPVTLTGSDVAAMMALMKISRISSGNVKADNWIDLAGYAACGGELQTGSIKPTAMTTVDTTITFKLQDITSNDYLIDRD